MLVSMTPNEEVKTIHASLNDGSLRKWEFEPYTEQGKIELTDQDYAKIQSIKGNTVKFNQIHSYNGKTNIRGITSVSNNGIWELSGTATGGYSACFDDFNIIENHKYYVHFKVLANPNNITFTVGSLNANINATTSSSSRLASSGVTRTTSSGIQSYSTGTNFDGVKFEFYINDLTAMGIDNLTTVEQVETWLSNNIGLLPYYDYTLGSLISFNGTGLKTENASQTESNTLSLPISTYFPTGMKNISNTNVYDEMTSSRADTRVGSVDLGTLDWQYSSGYSLFYANVEGAKYSGSGSLDGYDCECAIYNSAGNKVWAIFSNLDINVGSDTIGNNKPCVNIKNTSFTDATTFKNAMSGVILYYELATPTSQDISLDLTYPIWNGGTEQILPVNSSTPTTSPMVATIEYPDRTEDVDFLYKQTTFESANPQFSLVCKNQELPMALEDGKLICECDSSITNESGFFDCKVKMQDLDSVAYSQKIQLHVERGIND